MSRAVIVATFFSISSVALLAACREAEPFSPADLSAVRDMAAGGEGGTDFAGRMYTEATPNQINTNMAGGMFGDGVAVKLAGMVVTTPVAKFVDSPFCKYEVWVQDPDCTTAPCGILAIAKGPMLKPLDGGTRDCPNPSQAQTILATIQQDDNVDLYGVVDVFRPTGSMVTQHKLDLDMITRTSGKRTVTPFSVTDPTVFVNNTGSGWATYEGTLVTVAPTGGTLTVQNSFPMNRPTFETTPGPALWGYAFLFDDPRVMIDGGTRTFPVEGMTFNAITGVATSLFGGQILPRSKEDFAPENGL